jgi:cytochrome c
MRILTCCTFFLLTLFTTTASAQEAGNPGAGLAFARASCSECHSVENNDRPSPLVDAPRFPDIANKPGMTGFALTAFLETPHQQMPNFMISAEDQANVIAYILSLKAAQSQ